MRMFVLLCGLMLSTVSWSEQCGRAEKRSVFRRMQVCKGTRQSAYARLSLARQRMAVFVISSLC